MRIIAISLALLFWFSNSMAACGMDFSGTAPTTEGKGLPSWDWCFNCRELNRFPADYSNQAWNYVQNAGDYGFVWNRYYNRFDDVGAQETMPLRLCSPHGQCATTMITVNFNTFSFGFGKVSINIRTGIDNYQLVTVLPRGRSYEVTYFALEGLMPPDSLPVPATNEDDGFDDGDCLDNDQEQAAPEPGSGEESGGSSGGGDAGDYWESWEQGYGGQIPPSCVPDFSDPAGSGIICDTRPG